MRVIERLNRPAVFIIALVLVLAIDGILFYRFRLIEEDTTTASAPSTTTTTQLESTQASSASTSKQQGGSTTAQGTTVRGPATTKEGTSASSEKTGPLRLGVSVVDTPSWLSVQVDGQTVLAGAMEPGFSQEFEANREVNVEAGNAGAIEVEVNGESQGRLGASGEATSRTFSR